MIDLPILQALHTKSKKLDLTFFSFVTMVFRLDIELKFYMLED